MSQLRNPQKLSVFFAFAAMFNAGLMYQKVRFILDFEQILCINICMLKIKSLLFLFILAVHIPKAQTAETVTENYNLIEIKTSPVAFLAQWITLDASIRLNQNFATGPAFILYTSGGTGGMLAPSYKGYAAGWQIFYYTKSVNNNGLYISGHAYFEEYRSFPHGSLNDYSDRRGFKINSAIGLYEQADYGLAVYAGLGIESKNHKVTEYKSDVLPTNVISITQKDENFILPFLEFKVGYSF